MSPSVFGSCVKGLVTNLENHQKVELSGRMLAHCRCALEEDVGTLILFSLSFTSWPARGEENSLP